MTVEAPSIQKFPLYRWGSSQKDIFTYHRIRLNMITDGELVPSKLFTHHPIRQQAASGWRTGICQQVYSLSKSIACFHETIVE